VVIENFVRAENATISSACRHSLLEKLIEVSVQQRCNGVLNRRAWSAEKNPVSARDEIALVHKTNGSYRRRGPTNSKRRGVGIDDGVLQAEESLRCARVLASPRLSIPEHLWPAPDEFGSLGSRQNNFAESGATIFHSTRSCGPSIPGERNRSTAPQMDFAMEIAAR
jgi:hypothetical protein